ncbi:hypothetical protein CLOP_g15979 [Closterium sp. NIES-67]|nr:hypothetical protein CLOP_g15979 [Closterium sp. NIES-67]
MGGVDGALAGAGGAGRAGDGRVVCVTCGARREQLYRVHSPGSIEVLKCGACGAVADPYVECDPLLVLLDVLLLKPQAHRHVVHNLILASPLPSLRPCVSPWP